MFATIRITATAVFVIGLISAAAAAPNVHKARAESHSDIAYGSFAQRTPFAPAAVDSAIRIQDRGYRDSIGVISGMD
jgi:hypothetical protein